MTLLDLRVGLRLFARQENERVGSGAVGLNPVDCPVRGLVDRHDHAALGKTALVLMFVFAIDLSIVSVMMTLE